MTDSGVTWNTSDIFCQRCNKSCKGISIKNNQMMPNNFSLELCANCFSDIADETKDFRI